MKKIALISFAIYYFLLLLGAGPAACIELKDAGIGNNKHFLKNHDQNAILAHISFLFEEEESLEDLIAHSNLLVFREVLFFIKEKNPKQKSFAYYHRLQISPKKAPIYLLDEVFLI